MHFTDCHWVFERLIGSALMQSLCHIGLTMALYSAQLGFPCLWKVSFNHSYRRQVLPATGNRVDGQLQYFFWPRGADITEQAQVLLRALHAALQDILTECFWSLPER